MDDQSQTPATMPEAAPPPPPPVSGWAAPPATPVPGAAGFVYADVPNRLIAWIIDVIVVGFVYVIVAVILAVAGLSAGVTSGGEFNAVADVVFAIVFVAITAAYFIWGWTSMRATIGMRLLGMQVGNAFDGKTLTMEQAVRRALALWGPGLASSVFGNIPGIGPVISLLAFGWVIYLLYSTAASPTKQGFHDKFANSVVVKASRVV